MNDNERAYAEDDDPAAEAFSRLEREMALMRRAVEHLAAEKADITIPDYTITLGEMAQYLNQAQQELKAIAARPTLKLTPKDLAQHIDEAARMVRRSDHEELRGARERYDRAAHALNGVVATVQTADEQRRHLLWAVGGGGLAGCLLWAVLPGVILRALPDSWHGPEMMATHIVGAPSMWQAGERLMRAGNPDGWREVVRIARVWDANRDALQDCEETAAETGEPVRCTVKVTPTS